jgi:hypothetical protein
MNICGNSALQPVLAQFCALLKGRKLVSAWARRHDSRNTNLMLITWLVVLYSLLV